MHTLLEAILLVVIVVIVFLQTWRASIIPLLAVPVSLIGTLGVMHLFGFGLNTLSLFGLVLAIGIVVDDAIVVVENVERNISEGLSPIEATKQAMTRSDRSDHRDRARAVRRVPADRVHQRPVGRVLQAVRADDRDLDGDLRLQFADVVARAVGAAAASRTMRRPIALTRILNGALGWFFRPFNRFFARASNGYVGNGQPHARPQLRSRFSSTPA